MKKVITFTLTGIALMLATGQTDASPLNGRLAATYRGNTFAMPHLSATPADSLKGQPGTKAGYFDKRQGPETKRF